MECSFDNFIVVSIDVMISKYENIIPNLLTILKIEYCVYKDIMYTPSGIMDKSEKQIEGNKVCNCKDFLFELNLLYYIYQSNECLLRNGQVGNQVFSFTRKLIILDIYSDKDIENVDINQNQSSAQKVQLINVNDPTVMSSMSKIYKKCLMGVIEAFDTTGQPKNVMFRDSELEQKLFKTYGYERISNTKTDSKSRDSTTKTSIKEDKSTIMGFFPLNKYNKVGSGGQSDTAMKESKLEVENSFEEIVNENINVLIKTMAINNQTIKISIENVEWEKANIEINQESIVNIVIEKLSDGVLEKFFEKIFQVTEKSNCYFIKEEEEEPKKDNTLLYIILFIVILSIILIFVIIFLLRR